MNQTVKHLPNGDFQIDPILVKARNEALRDMAEENHESLRFHVSVLKQTKNQIAG